MAINKHKYAWLALTAVILAFGVVTMGAYTRLVDGGLGCPDWPGCYGQISVPKTQQQIANAHSLYPEQKVEPKKAWPEMIHRYIAGTLGVLIILLAWLSFRQKNQATVAKPSQGIIVFLVGMVIFQAALGMWTVTWKLHPLVVMGHLLGGLTILGLLWWTSLTMYAYPLSKLYMWKTSTLQLVKLRKVAIISLIVLIGQLALGGWTSSNYAAIICPDFPFCQGKLIPELNFSNGFNIFSSIGVNYQGGVLDNIARMTIHMSHRMGAIIVAVVLLYLSLRLILSDYFHPLRRLGWIILALLFTQIIFGIISAMKLPLGIALAHNAVAALLLLSIITVNFYVCQNPVEHLRNG